jgi:hypothetical protein
VGVAGLRFCVGREQRERLPVERADHTKMTLIERRERVRGPLGGEDDHRGIGKAKLDIAVACAELTRRLQTTRIECLNRIGHGKILNQRQLCVYAQTAEHEMVGLGSREGRDHQLAGPSLKGGNDRGVIWVGDVGGAIERAGIDDQRLYCPSS